jgi:hypothetical protein
MEAMVVDPSGCSQYDKSVGRIGILNGCRSHEPLFSASIILALRLKMLIGGALVVFGVWIASRVGHVVAAAATE